MKRAVRKTLLQKPLDPIGTIISVSVIVLWTLSLCFLLTWEFSYSSPLIFLAVIIQTHLYTGLFISAHDAMHGTVSKNKRINRLIGQITSFLFAFNFYNELLPKHHQHHRHPHLYCHIVVSPEYHSNTILR